MFKLPLFINNIKANFNQMKKFEFYEELKKRFANKYKFFKCDINQFGLML